MDNIPLMDNVVANISPPWTFIEGGKDKVNNSTQDDNYRIKTIVIDPGHGGHDPGCTGGHAHEKEIVLDIALQLGKSISDYFPHINVIYTRTTDVFIPLYQRAKIANQNKADLFISIHCNSIVNASGVRGSETYVLGLHRAADNLEVAKRENASIYLEDNYQSNYMGYDPNSAETHILMSMFQNAFLEQSISFAEKVEYQIRYGAHGKSRGVKQAGFLVLRETAMPSVLIESGYLSNATDDHYLNTNQGKHQMAQAIFRAFKDYKQEIESADGSNPPAIQQEINYAQNRQQITTPKSAPSTSPNNFSMTTRKNPGTSSIYIPALPAPSTTATTTTTVDRTSTKTAFPQILPIVYRVQMASGTDLIDTQKAPWNKVNKSIEIRQEGNRYKYLSPSFINIQDAITYRDHLKKIGFSDAFVVTFQGSQRLK